MRAVEHTIDLTAELKGLIADIITIKSIAESQIDILKLLRDVYAITLREWREQLGTSLKRINEVILEDRSFQQKLDGICRGAERSLKSVFSPTKLPTSQSLLTLAGTEIH